jgi:predicted hotdog family 3-hydroxylacyl-ACP dehydratase
MDRKWNIMDLIPQRPPFVMVEDVLFSDEEQTGSVTTITRENIMTENGHFTEEGLLENMAQTTAIHAGITARKEGVSMPMRVIGGLKEVEIYRLPRINETIKTVVSPKLSVINAKIFEGQVFSNETLIARGEIKVFDI